MGEVRYPTLREIEQALARKGHIDFMRWCWQRNVDEDPFLVGYHTRTICRRVDGAIEDFRNGKSTFLMIKCVYRHGKSDMVSRFLPPHFLGEFPDHEVVVAGYSSSLTDSFSKFARNLMRSEQYGELYPGVKLSKEDQSVDSWGIEKRLGKTWWVGLGGSITGKGGSLILIDDFFKGREEAESEVIRDKVWESFSNDIMTRRAPVAIVIVLATPWHCDDLFGRIKKKMDEDENFPKFEELKFPARDEKYVAVNGTPYLFPERFDEQWYEGQFATLGPYASAALLQCDPVVRHGNLFKIDNIKYYDTLPEHVRLTRGWDLASSEKQRVKDDPDYTASIRLGVQWQAQGGDLQPLPVLYIDDFTIDRLAAPERDRKIKRIAMADGNVEIGIESYGPYKDAYKNLQDALWGLRKVTKVQLPGDKVTRAEALEPAFEAGNVYMRKASWNAELLRYLAEFPGGAHDDPVDALVTAFALHKPYVKHVWPLMSSVRTVGFNLNWEKKKENERSVLHYGAVVLERDLSLWVLCTLWDDVSGQLFVYDCLMAEEPMVQNVAMWMVNHMHLKQYSVDKIVCNDRMVQASEGTEKTMQRLFREEFKKLQVNARLSEAVRYDQWGSISQVNKVLSDKQLFVENKTDDALMQWSGWVVEKNKPVHENTGWCECLCLIVAELKRKNAFRERIARKDYVSDAKMREILRNDPIRNHQQEVTVGA